MTTWLTRSQDDPNQASIQLRDLSSIQIKLVGIRSLSIFAVSDLVLDVANAADPTRRKQALDRLETLGQNAAPDAAAGTDFAAHVNLTGGGPSLAAESVAAMQSKLENTHDHHLPHGNQSGLQKFEAFVLGNFIGLMMPKGNDAVYGKGMAGEMWESLSAQYIGDAVAKRGGIGLAKSLAPHYPQQTGSGQG